MDREKFYEARQKVMSGGHLYAGIGTYGEKTVHAVLKNYFQPYDAGHEQKIGGFIADIVGEDGIIEIQTSGFDKLRKKLEAFLSVARVTVVHPIAYNKWIINTDAETGNTGKKRKSPHKGNVYGIFPELYKIKRFISDENLSICIVMLDIEEYRTPPETKGLRRGRRKGYTIYDRIPAEINEEVLLREKTDWLYFIPASIKEKEFTSLDFSKAAGISFSLAQITLNVLTVTGAVERTGKKGNYFIYSANNFYI